VVALTAGPASAAPTVVTDEASLFTAWQNDTSIQLANDITLDCSIGELDRTTTNGDVVLDGQNHTLTENCSSSGTRETLEVSSGDDNVTVQNLTLTANGADNIGAIEMEGGTGGLTLNGVTMTNNHNHGGGAVEVTNDGTADLTVINSTFMNNASCGSNGGAIEYRTGGNVVISGSTIANNQSGDDGGAIALDNNSHDLTVTNSTITGNTALNVGGLEVDHGNATLTYVTDVNNTTGVPLVCPASASASPSDDDNAAAETPDKHPHDAAPQAVGDTPANLRVSAPDSMLTTFASVIAQPHGGPNCGDFSTPTVALTNTVSNGFNFADDTSCGLTGTGDSQVATNDPLLGGLGDNGGRNPTLLPQTGSPLSDKVPLASCQAGAGITIDERKLPRPSGAGCDIGAVEVQVAVLAARFTG
jgi:hypothetical protein